MVKKVKKTAGSTPMAEAAPAGAGLLDSQFGQLVKESAQQIWSAGLAAFAKAQNNSGKAFDTLAEEGARIQKKTQASAEERLGAVASRMSDMAGEVGTRAGQHWDKLESIFEDRVARALHRLGVPTAKDLEALHQRLEALTLALQAQGGDAPAATAKPVKAVTAPKAVKAVKPATPAKPSKPATSKSSKNGLVKAASSKSGKAAQAVAASPVTSPKTPARAATRAATQPAAKASKAHKAGTAGAAQPSTKTATRRATGTAATKAATSSAAAKKTTAATRTKR